MEGIEGFETVLRGLGIIPSHSWPMGLMVECFKPENLAWVGP